MVISYGVISSIGQNLAIIPTLTVPMMWFPNNKGLVSGIVVSGFGIGAFIFNQIQTKLVNPDNVAVADDGYFHDAAVLSRVPQLLHLLGLMYLTLLCLGALLMLCFSKPKEL